MCEPVTIGLATAAIVGGGLKAAGSIIQGYDEAQALETSAKLAELSAADVVQRGEGEAARVRMAATRMIGQQKVAAAASGVASDTGTALDVMADTRLISELDAQTLRNIAARDAWGYKVKAAQDRRGAKAAMARGVLGAAGSGISTTTTLLGGLFGG